MRKKNENYIYVRRATKLFVCKHRFRSIESLLREAIWSFSSLPCASDLALVELRWHGKSFITFECMSKVFCFSFLHWMQRRLRLTRNVSDGSQKEGGKSLRFLFIAISARRRETCLEHIHTEQHNHHLPWVIATNHAYSQLKSPFPAPSPPVLITNFPQFRKVMSEAKTDFLHEFFISHRTPFSMFTPIAGEEKIAYIINNLQCRGIEPRSLISEGRGGRRKKIRFVIANSH